MWLSTHPGSSAFQASKPSLTRFTRSVAAQRRKLFDAGGRVVGDGHDGELRVNCHGRREDAGVADVDVLHPVYAEALVDGPLGGISADGVAALGMRGVQPDVRVVADDV